MAPVTSHRGRRCPFSRLGVFHGLRHGRRALTVRATIGGLADALPPKGWCGRTGAVGRHTERGCLTLLSKRSLSSVRAGLGLPGSAFNH